MIEASHQPNLKSCGVQTQDVAITLLEKLRLESEKQEKQLTGSSLSRFKAAYKDALVLSLSLENYQSPNVVAVAEDGEIVFEWYNKKYHVVVSLDGDGEYGYSYEFAGQHAAGLYNGFCDQCIPDDLRAYLLAVAVN